jgi:hypothetical protein
MRKFLLATCIYAVIGITTAYSYAQEILTGNKLGVTGSLQVFSVKDDAKNTIWKFTNILDTEYRIDKTGNIFYFASPRNNIQCVISVAYTDEEKGLVMDILEYTQGEPPTPQPNPEPSPIPTPNPDPEPILTGYDKIIADYKVTDSEKQKLKAVIAQAKKWESAFTSNSKYTTNDVKSYFRQYWNTEFVSNNADTRKRYASISSEIQKLFDDAIDVKGLFIEINELEQSIQK